jgi:putative heme-binding domain-containing protein
MYSFAENASSIGVSGGLAFQYGMHEGANGMKSACAKFLVLGIACAVLLSAVMSYPTAAQGKNPYAADAKMARLGEFEFRANCAFCHGLGARGGGRGPDLTRTPKKHGNSDADIFNTINNGVPGTAMPPNGATQQGVGMTEEEIWQVVTYIRSVERKPAMVSGDAKHGKELFYGIAACATCHMFAGQGGRLGPDLTGAGTARSTEYLTESLRNPSRRLAQGISEAMKEFSVEYETVNVVKNDGTKYQGTLLNEDSFTIQFIDTREQVRSLDKTSLKSWQKSRESLMPVYDEKTLPEKDLQDLLAFLVNGGAGGVK